MMDTASLLFVEVADADRSWMLVVQSSDGVIGHVFRVNAEYAYFAGPFNALSVTFSDPTLERLKERIIASRR